MLNKVDTRTFLSIFWSIGAFILMTYILVKFGARTEILTLLIGFLQGTIVGGIFSVYFGGTHAIKKLENETTN